MQVYRNVLLQQIVTSVQSVFYLVVSICMQIRYLLSEKLKFPIHPTALAKCDKHHPPFTTLHLTRQTKKKKNHKKRETARGFINAGPILVRPSDGFADPHQRLMNHHCKPCRTYPVDDFRLE